MSYLSNFPPCFPHSRQNRSNYTGGKDPDAEYTEAAADWIASFVSPLIGSDMVRRVGRKTIDVVRS